jgi:hypothetical protein
MVAFLADSHALIHDFRIESGEKLCRALVDRAGRFAVGGAGRHDESERYQRGETYHEDSGQVMFARCCTSRAILASPGSDVGSITIAR